MELALRDHRDEGCSGPGNRELFILKPSEKTPFAALALGELVRDAGFPPGVFQVLSGDGSTGALLASHMRVSKISFTGSVNTGKKIMEMAAKSNQKRITLELGGKSPAIVFDDADIANAVQWCSSAIVANTGQVCFAASRVYVHEAVCEEFTQEYLRVMAEKAKVVGSPDDPIMEIGPLVDAAQFERVAGLSNGFREIQVNSWWVAGSLARMYVYARFVG